MRIKFLYILSIVCLNHLFGQTDYDNSALDSIYLLRQNSKNQVEFSKIERLGIANRAILLSQRLDVDSTLLKSNQNASDIFWELEKYFLYKKTNHSNLLLSIKLKDSASLGIANYNIARFFRKQRKTDSAYFYYNKAEDIFRAINDNYNLANALLGIAIIQKNEKDFTGSEVTSIEGLALLNILESSQQVILKKAYFYNNLGVVFQELELFEESITYQKKSLSLKGQLSGNTVATIDNSKNNLGAAYKNSGQYKQALNYFDEIIKNNRLINTRPSFYALVLDNYAHTLYLSNNKKTLPSLYLKALKISDSIDYKGYNSIIMNQHLAEYYLDNNQMDSAKYYGYRAKEISEQYHNDDLLKSLLLLSEIEDDSMGLIHTKTYIKLSDSLQKNERSIRNKFARIRFETNQLEKENIEIAKERLWLLIISIVVIIASFLLYIIINQRNKNKELQFIQKQQETNEEIYNLMLSQNETIEEARTSEKKRISQELHDGILGRLFGTRLSLDSLNMSNSNEAIKTRSQYIDGLKTIEEDIRKVSHELNTDFVSGSGFIDIIKTLIERQSLAYNLKYDLNHDDGIHWDEVTNKKKIHIYRIIQEALHNIYKHANATQVTVNFKLKKNVICLILTDDGLGFDVNKAKSGIGLKNMNARINEINGTVEITSEREVGTTVIIQVPIT